MVYHWRWHSLRMVGRMISMSADEVIKDKSGAVNHTSMLKYIKFLSDNVEEAIAIINTEEVIKNGSEGQRNTCFD